MYLESFVNRSGSELHRIDVVRSTEFTRCCIGHYFPPRRTLMRNSMFCSPCKTLGAFRRRMQHFGRVPFLYSVAVNQKCLDLESHFDCSRVNSNDGTW